MSHVAGAMTNDPLDGLLPLPQLVERRPGTITLTARTRIVLVADEHAPDAHLHEHVVTHLVGDVHRASGLHLSRADTPVAGDVVLQLDGNVRQHGAEGYALDIDEQGARLRAATAHGLWNGSRTLVQLFAHDPADTSLPCVHIVDHPRFEWRGAMLDVARHFFGVDHVLRFVELIARFKLNRLHLHLTDDQGWRIDIDGWPALTGIGGASAVGGGTGGWFSREDYREIIAHAARHFVTVVPEVDMPGHTNAALASVPALNPDGVCPPRYTGRGVGFSSLRLTAPATRRFVADVIAQLAADTPGEFLHIGGDEAHVTEPGEYRQFVELLQQELTRHGKRMVGWEEIATTPLAPGAVVQHWLQPPVAALAPTGTRFLMSPAAHTYLDMRHAADDRIGRRWAGMIDVDTAYGWDPAAQLDGVGDDRIVGVEAPLWTEKVPTFADVEELCFPRLACIGEVGWTPQARRTWDGFRPRAAVHAERLRAIGVQVYRSALLV